MLILLTAIMLQAGAPPPPLHIGTTELTCPIGGERFAATTTLMYSVSGRRPDGLPYSEVPFPRPIPECPGNGLVMFDTFTTTDTQKLGPLIASPVYQSMRRTESAYYRAYWLATKLGRPAADAIELLLPGIWNAKDEDGADPRRPRTVRYQRALIAAIEKDAADVPLDDRLWLYEQAANAAREMGRFDDAKRWVASADGIVIHTKRPALATHLDKLKAVIARKERDDEPLDMIPDIQAALICRDHPPRTGFAQGYCAKPEISRLLRSEN